MIRPSAKHHLQVEDVAVHRSVLDAAHAAAVVSDHSSDGAHGRAARIGRKEESVGLEGLVQPLLNNARLDQDLQILNLDLQFLNVSLDLLNRIKTAACGYTDCLERTGLILIDS